ncbi:MAG TPA: hypothetical protein VE175_00480 [Woeseiaceae bacterium]|nr:hypothetical protein [Woeseiaceae bacterium]
MRRARRKAFAPALALGSLLAACGSGFSGEYEDELGTTRYEFTADGRVYMSVLGIESVGEYEVDGKRVVLSGPNGSIVLSRDGDELIGPMGLKLHRR